jgi:hypothetical protein
MGGLAGGAATVDLRTGLSSGGSSVVVDGVIPCVLGLPKIGRRSWGT